jgi:hypothetical protein
MRSKPAELSSDLVAIKGTAFPSPDMPGRATAPVVSLAARETSTTADHDEPKEPNLTPLNFRVRASFRREFRTYAATHDLKLNELLRLCFEAYRRQQSE